MNRMILFCHHMADWLSEEEWHFTTLLATFIGSVENLPDDADDLVNKMLLEFPTRPQKKKIAQFLQSSSRVRTWFRLSGAKPKVVSFCLQVPQPPQLTDVHLPGLDTVGDLAEWLNVSHKALDWLADLKRYDEKAPSHFRHYHYSIVKKRNGRQRLLESPKGLLKRTQRKINHEVLSIFPIHDAAHGFRKDKSCKTHAELHVDKNYLFLFDLAHCFQSIGWHSVYSQYSSLGYTPEVSKYLTGLCTHRGYSNHEQLSQLDAEQRTLLLERHLAQGAPSSPALSNIVLLPLDKRLTGLAKSLELQYSRYADDLAFSGDNHRDWSFLEPLIGSICLEEGFSLNYRKTRLLKPHQRQKITGINVNEKTNVDRRYYDQLKATLTNCIRYGLDSQNRYNHSNFRAYLHGSVQHVKFLNEAKGTKLEGLLKRIA